jgi:hypothetical protein
MLGSATFTTRLSSTTMNNPIETIASVHLLVRELVWDMAFSKFLLVATKLVVQTLAATNKLSS